MKLTYNLHLLANIKQSTIQLHDQFETNIENLVFVNKIYFLYFFLHYIFLILLVVPYTICRIFCGVCALLCLVWQILLKKIPLKDLEKPITLKESEKVSDFICVDKNIFFYILLYFCMFIILVVLGICFIVIGISKTQSSSSSDNIEKAFFWACAVVCILMLLLTKILIRLGIQEFFDGKSLEVFVQKSNYKRRRKI